MQIYLWAKALHLIFMVAWFAGLFYIFRLFVYHIKHRHEAAVVGTLTVMERKLLRIIMLPAMILTLFSGLTLITLNPYLIRASWFHFKLVGVVFLIAYHLFSVWTHQRLAQGDYFLSEKTCRLINEVPTILLILIILLVVLKPV